MTTARPPEGGQYRSPQGEGIPEHTARPPEGGQHRSPKGEGIPEHTARPPEGDPGGTVDAGGGPRVVHAHVLEDLTGLTLDDLCRACDVAPPLLVDLVEEGVIAPAGTVAGEWRFTGLQLRHARVAVRLQRDLGVNPAGAALALQLLDELDRLRALLAASGSGRGASP